LALSQWRLPVVGLAAALWYLVRVIPKPRRAGDGRTLDSDAINRTITAANSAGGGTVRFPAGTYLTASLHLKSNVALDLEQGSVIEAVSETVEAYDAPEPTISTRYQDSGHSHWHNALIWGEHLENVSILGPGLINGKGLQSGLYDKTYHDTPPGSGNNAISLVNCHNVILRDFSVLHGGWFAILATGSRLRGPENTPVGGIRRINISNVVVSGAGRKFGSIISGIPGHPVTDVRISNLQILQDGGGTARDASRQPPEKETAYPEPSMFGTTPAYGFYIRHAAGMEFSGATVRTVTEDLRPAFALEEVTGAMFANVRCHSNVTNATFVLKQVGDFNLNQCLPLPDQWIKQTDSRQL
jgi:polygalacturonase